MAKTQHKILAQEMRRAGESIKKIATRLDISQSTASIWCRDIQLETGQLKKLKNIQKAGSMLGRLKGAETRKRKRLAEIETLKIEGIKELSFLDNREFFTAGIGLYWGEGLKTSGVAGIVNSDPKIILFMQEWFKRYCQVTNLDFICRVGINNTHKKRIREVEEFWSELTEIPLSQFTKPGIYKTKTQKVYENHNEHFGTLSLKIRRSTKTQRRILGWIEGLYRGGVAQLVRAQDS